MNATDVIIVLAIIALIYLWHKLVYSPGKYNNRKNYSSSSSDDGDFWFGSFGDSDDGDGDGGGDD